MTFEARLSDALDRYADRVPAETEIAAVAQAATATRARRVGTGRPFAWARRSVALRLGIAVALLALAAVAIALVGWPRDPTLGGGRLMVSLGTTGWVFDPSLAAPREVVVGEGCGSTLVDGGAQVVTGSGSLGKPARIRPIDADLLAMTGLFGQEIPGYGGHNSEWWSANGAHVALIHYAKQDDHDPPGGVGAIMIVSTKGDAARPIFEVPDLFAAAWSDDGSHIAALGLRGTDVELTDIDLVGGVKRSVVTFPPSTNGGGFLAWTAAGSKVAVWVATAEGDRPALVDMQSGTVTTVRPPSDLPLSESGYSLLWSPDGTRAVLLGPDANATALMMVAADGSKLFDVPGGSSIDTFRGPTSWAPDGRHLALLDGDVIHMMSADGHAIGSLTLAGSWTSTQRVAWSPDGRAFAMVTPGNASLELVMYDANTLARIASSTIPTRPPVTGEFMCLQWVRPID